MPAAKQMEMDVVDRLAAFGVTVRHEPEPSFGDVLVSCYLVSNLEQMAYEMIVCLFKVEDCRDMFFRYDQGMDRGLRIYILEREGDFIFIDDHRRDLPFDDPAENAIIQFQISILVGSTLSPIHSFSRLLLRL